MKVGWLVLVLTLLLGVPQGTLAAPGPSPRAEPSADPSPRAERPDLYLDMPYNLGGFEPDVVMRRGDEHVANLAPGDEARLRLHAMLDLLGADLEDMSSGYALVSQDNLFAFVVGIRVIGIEPGSLLPAYLPILFDELVEPASIAGTIGGRTVLIVTSVGAEDEPVDLYVYDEGDTVWMVQGPLDVVELALESLPDPLG